MKLHVSTQGQGKDLVLLHGWGFHGDIWEHITAKLASNYRVTCVDLPGYGRSDASTIPLSLDETTTEVAKHVPDPATWAGWSLGGLIALNQTLNHPESIEKLILIASTPQFTQNDAWPCAIKPSVLESFATELENDYAGTIKQFIALQAQGCPDAYQQIRELQAQIFRHGQPSTATLRNGLDLLKQSSLTDKLHLIDQPALIISGMRDRLVPPGAIEAIQTQLCNAETCVIKNAGHAPFISHPQMVSDAIMAFLQ